LNTEGDSELQEKEASFADYIHILIKWRKLVVTNFIIVAILSVIISLLLPKWYKSTSLIMPPSQSTFPGFTSTISELPLSFMGLGLGPGSEELDLYIAILKSRTVAENVISKFELIDKYGVENMEEAVEAFSSNVFFEVQDEGTVSISVLDKDQESVHKIANYFVEELDRTNQRLATHQARNNRIFIERRVADTEKKLKEVENSMKEFQEIHTAINIETQTEEAIRAAAGIKVNIMMLDVKIGVLEKSVSKSHPELLKSKLELSELQKRYDLMRFGGEEPTEKDIFPPFTEIPELGIEYIRLLREVEIQNEILKFLLQEYEQAKIQEAKDTPTVQILDVAVRPEKKARPRRALICFSSTFAVLLLTWIWIIFKEGYENQQKPV
jgi:uncharacterized protein involved in exopolysaccharide biosynthesis